MDGLIPFRLRRPKRDSLIPSPPPAAPATLDAASLKEDLWNRAYDQLKSKEGNIVEAYERLLSAKLVNFHSLPNAATQNQFNNHNEERRKQMQNLVTAGLEKTEQETAFKQKIDHVAKILSPVKELIEEAVKACPQGAIAWAGVSCLLEVSRTRSGFRPLAAGSLLKARR